MTETPDTLHGWLEMQRCSHPFEIELGLERVREVAQRMQLLPAPWPVVTVAGTNGKGSTVAMLNAILQAQGFKVGSYTSPHIHRYNERVRIGRCCADDAELCRAFEIIERKRGEISLSFFETGTLAALHCFHRHRPDIVILETGLGGRLDAVNIVDADVAVITSIGIDHTEWLGDNRESIGAEKAGIVRLGRPCICGDPQPPASITALPDKGVQLQCLGRDFDYRKHAQDWEFIFGGKCLDALPFPNLFGEAQFRNACCALAALQNLGSGFEITPDAVRLGLAGVELTGRFEIRRRRSAGGECLQVFDIAHNPHGAQVMAGNLARIADGGKFHAVLAILSSKDADGVVEAVAPYVDRWYLSEAKSSQALPVGQLHATVTRHAGGAPAHCFDSVARACRAATSDAGGRLLVFGSMLTVSEALDSGI